MFGPGISVSLTPKKRAPTKPTTRTVHMKLRPKRSRLHCCESCRTPRQTTIAQLSDEILLAVFAHLDKPQLLATVPLVNRRWRRLHADPSLYRELELRGDSIDTATAVRLLRMSPWLQHLTIANRWDADKLLPVVRAHNLNLDTLSMHNVKGHPVRMFIDDAQLRALVYDCSRLRTLSLTRTFCGTQAFHRVVGITTQTLCKAIHFDSYTETLPHAELRTVRGSTSCLPPPVTDATVATLAIQHRATLHRLKLYTRACTDLALRSLATCRHLARLHLFMHRSRRVTWRGLATVANLPALTELCIFSAEQVGVEAWACLFAKPFMRRLKTLSLYMCKNVDDAVCSVIAMNAVALRSLSIVGCSGVTDRGRLQVMRHLNADCHYDFKIYTGKYHVYYAMPSNVLATT